MGKVKLDDGNETSLTLYEYQSPMGKANQLAISNVQ